MQTTLRPFGDPFSIAFTIGGLPILWYSIFFMLGFFVSIIVACLVCQYRYKLKYDVIFWFAVFLIPIAIFGARFGSAVIGDLKWENFFSFRTGGLAIQGGIIFAVIYALIYFPIILSKPRFHIRTKFEDKIVIRQPSMWIILDIVAPVVLLGHAIGRWGNFFNGEIFGSEVPLTDLNWLKAIMPGVVSHMQLVKGADLSLAEGLVNGAYYQPLFLYESFANVIIWIILYWGLPYIKQIKIGVTGSSYFICYGIIRFITESFRFSSYTFIGNYVTNALLLISGLVLVISAQFFAPRYRDQKIIYYLWIKYIRFYTIKLGLKMKLKYFDKYSNFDPKMERYGLANKPNFERSFEEIYYYGNR